MIRAYHVTKRYGDVHALRDVTLKLGKGEFCYVTGPSGAGKTTMLKMLYGAVQPTEGKLLVGGVDVSRLSKRRLPYLRRNIGIVFQDFKLIPTRTLAENVGLALEVLGTSRDVIDRRVNAVLGIVGLRGRGHEYPPTLSGGEQQRVAVARAIVNDPSILLADEPTGNLDGAMAIEVMEILQAINLRGTTVMVATHDTGLMNRFPFRKLRFEAGRLVES
ncbi:MAG: cell division ATP-binding protein FtsE [Myxococcota bacterium]|nr:cell division ATP-binding protein FtsE [Myxococcota bacterium]MEC9390924.1 cell division ATP-binding protein FtsE [Myxococcota bacterium]